MFEMFQLPFMVQAFAAAAITGILLSYLGVHVVGRGIVFVDLALGQISSLGVAFAAFIGTGMTSIPLIFTLAGALLMSFINIRDKRLKQEAIIGILYAFASALTVLLISKTPHGDSDIQEVLFGNILSVSWAKITTIGIVFGAIGLVQLIFFRKFFALTRSFENGENHLVGIFNFWNFLFYISIGLAIVYAVKINGVIPVFSYLIVPSVSAIMLSKSNVNIFIIAAVISILASFFGLYFSFHYDFPAGSSIVAILGGIFVLASLFKIVQGLVVKKKSVKILARDFSFYQVNCDMEITFNTPALLFPAISLLLLAYGNRFLALANLVRKLHDEYISGHKSKILLRQIHSLRRRLNMIRYMQGLGVFSFLCCVACMYCLYRGWGKEAEYIFAVSLLSLLTSLIISLIEIFKSTNAIELELSDIEELEKSNFFSDLISRDHKGKEV